MSGILLCRWLVIFSFPSQGLPLLGEETSTTTWDDYITQRICWKKAESCSSRKSERTKGLQRELKRNELVSAATHSLGATVWGPVIPGVQGKVWPKVAKEGEKRKFRWKTWEGLELIACFHLKTFAKHWNNSGNPSGKHKWKTCPSKTEYSF
jgi:hypothetical protein